MLAPGSLGVNDRLALGPLTVDFHEPGFASGLGEETRFTAEKGFWFQLGDDDKPKAKPGWGPDNPQALNRYAYVLNNPVRYTDPSGHCGPCIRLLEKLGELIGRYGPSVVAWVTRMIQRLAPAAESASRVIQRADGRTLDPGRITVPGAVNSVWGKVDFLLGRVTAGNPENVAKSAARGELFAGKMGFAGDTLNAALQAHLIENFESAVVQANGNLLVRGMMTGPSGYSSMVTTVWQILDDGVVALVTAW